MLFRSLVVDDDPRVRELLRINLEFEGFAVREADDAMQALGLIELSAPDLVLVDVVMPGIDGWEMLRRMQELYGAIPVILFSGQLDQIARHGAMDLVVRSQLVARKMKVLGEANAELAGAEKKRPTYRRMILQAGSVDEWLRGGRDWLDHCAYLTAILPPSEDVYVTSFTVASQGSIRLAVQAQSGEILARLDQKLRAAGYDVKPLAITPGADRFGYEFRSSVELIVRSLAGEMSASGNSAVPGSG